MIIFHCSYSRSKYPEYKFVSIWNKMTWMKYIECLNKGNDTEIHKLIIHFFVLFSSALEPSINFDNSKLANYSQKNYSGQSSS